MKAPSVAPTATHGPQDRFASEAAIADLVVIASLPNNEAASNGSSRFVHVIANAFCDLGTRVTVFSQRSASRDPGAKYRQVPTWHPSQRSFFDILTTLLRQKVRLVILHHEIFLFGPLRVNAYFIVFLVVAKLFGFKVVTTMHHALDVAAIRQALSWDEHGHRIFSPIFAVTSRLFNALVALCSYRVTIHKSESLSAFHPLVRHRISIIPLVIEDGPVGDETASRRAILSTYDLPKCFILAFGFVSKYKGLETLIEAYETTPSLTPLLIVGSRNVRLRNRAEYRSYYDQLRARALRAGVMWLNYIPEEAVGPMFAAATAAVMPYKHHHAVSGPLSIAAAYGTPAIVSNVLHLEEFAGVDCAPEVGALTAAINRIETDARYVVRLREAAARYARNRSGEIVAQAYARIFE